MIDGIVNFTRRLTNCRSNIKVFAVSLINCYPACNTTCQSGNHTTNLADQVQTKLNRQLGSRCGLNHIFRLRLCSCSKVFETGPGFEIIKNLRIWLLFSLRQSSMQPKLSNVYFILKQWRLWKARRLLLLPKIKLTPVPGPVWLWLEKQAQNPAGIDSGSVATFARRYSA